jgi:hypothetical protein
VEDHGRGERRQEGSEELQQARRGVTAVQEERLAQRRGQGQLRQEGGLLRVARAEVPVEIQPALPSKQIAKGKFIRSVFL